MGNYMPSVEVNDLVRERMIKYGVVNIKLQETPTEDMYCIVADAVAETIKIVLKGAYPLQNPNEEKKKRLYQMLKKKNTEQSSASQVS